MNLVAHMNLFLPFGLNHSTISILRIPTKQTVKWKVRDPGFFCSWLKWPSINGFVSNWVLFTPRNWSCFTKKAGKLFFFLKPTVFSPNINPYHSWVVATHVFFIFTPNPGGNDPIWLTFFRWVGSTTARKHSFGRGMIVCQIQPVKISRLLHLVSWWWDLNSKFGISSFRVGRFAGEPSEIFWGV